MLSFYFCFTKGCCRRSNIGNTEIKNGIETEKTDSLDLVSHTTMNIQSQSRFQFVVASGPNKPKLVAAAQTNAAYNLCCCNWKPLFYLPIALVKCSSVVEPRHCDRLAVRWNAFMSEAMFRIPRANQWGISVFSELRKYIQIKILGQNSKLDFIRKNPCIGWGHAVLKERRRQLLEHLNTIID